MSDLLGLNLLAADVTVPAWQWWLTLALVFAFLVVEIVVIYTTRVGVIARATTKEAVRQPLFILLMVLGVLLLGVNSILPFFSLGEDIKMLKDCGLATILISGLLLAIWTASTSIASEIEGKTAMTLLSKPITRRQFVLGKFMGIMVGIQWLVVPLMLFLCFFIYFKVGYDAKERGMEVPPWLDGGWPNAQRLSEVILILPGFVLMFFEIGVLTAVSVAISTRAPMVVNMTSSLAIFVVGHLTPVMVQAGVFKIEIVDFMGKLIAIVLPNLEYFNMTTAVSTGQLVPPVYLLAACGYSLVYGTAVVLLAFILFEDRDLA